MNERSPKTSAGAHATPHGHGGPGAHPRPTARRRAPRADLRDRLLDAAEGLVSRQGATVTARQIAKSAGVADGALYNHFEDKHALVLSALMRRFERLAAAFEAEVAAGPGAAPATAGATGAGADVGRDTALAGAGGDVTVPLETTLSHLVLAAFRFQAAALPLLANALSEPELFRRLMVEIHRPPFGRNVFVDPFTTLLEAAAGRDARGDLDIRAATDLVVGAVLLNALHDLVTPADPAATEARLRTLVHTVVLGLAPRPSTP